MAVIEVPDFGANDQETQEAKGGPEDIAAHILYQYEKYLAIPPHRRTPQWEKYGQKHKAEIEAYIAAKTPQE